MSKSWVRNEIPTVRTSILFCVRPHVRPRFWMAETRSRKTKEVKVCACTEENVSLLSLSNELPGRQFDACRWADPGGGRVYCSPSFDPEPQFRRR